MPEEDTTPLALTAALIHEATRTVDTIAVGAQHAKRPWSDQTDAAKARAIRLVERARTGTFEEFYDFVTLALRMAGRTVAPSTDETDDLVRHVRMQHSIVQALIPASSSN